MKVDVSPALKRLRDKGDKGCRVQSWRGILVDEGDTSGKTPTADLWKSVWISLSKWGAS